MQNRRKFMKSSLLTLLGTGISAASPVRSFANNVREDPEKKFVYRMLGKTGIEVPVISLGTGNTDNPNLIKLALDEGIKLIATSEIYQNGNTEKMVGEAISKRPRDSYYIMTSAGDINNVDHEAGLYKPETDPEDFLKHADGSLRRLQVDYLDIFILPFAAKRESVFFEPLLKAMETFKKQGKTRFLGIATHMFQPEAIRAAVDTGIYDVVMTSYNFRMDNLKELDEAIGYAARAHLGIIAMKTMAGAFWDKERTKPINATAALKWVLQNKNVHTTVPDCSSYDHVYNDISVMGDLKLTKEEKHNLEPPSGELSSGLYCQQCLRCIPQCPKKVNIPVIMRSYMYAYGYRNLDFARKTLCSSNLNDRLCQECTECKVICRMGFDIRTKIMDIARLKDVPEDFIRSI
jgi:predicted aldo/keto reductase-like oxidoreductase